MTAIISCLKWVGGALRPVSSDVLHIPCLNYLEELLMLVQEGKLT